MMRWEKGKWAMTTEWTTEQWLRFEEAARAQAAIDDAVAAAAWPDAAPEDWLIIDKQCHAMYGRSLGAIYNQLRKAGRAAFLVSQAELASHVAGAAGWFGEKVMGIKDPLTVGSEKMQPVNIIIDTQGDLTVSGKSNEGQEAGPAGLCDEKREFQGVQNDDAISAQ